MDGRAVSSPREAPRYRRLAPIASGGMGSVDLCVRIEGGFRRLVAVKRLLPVLRVDGAVRSMFLDEARIAGLLRHPNVVSVVDVGEDEDGPYLVMDYVEGMSLHAMRGGMEGECMPVGVAARIVAASARGLHAAHELRGHDGAWLGLVHRDVSPHNVLVGFDGQVKLTDFGISKAVGQQTRTATGLLKGKLGYMAPEQLRFEEADRRSDVFALGVVLHELLTGAKLFEGEPRVIAQKVLNGTIPAVRDLRPELPAPIAELSARMLAMRADARPATAEEVALRLEELLRDGTIPGPSDVAAFANARFDPERRARAEQVAALLARVDAVADETPREPVPEAVTGSSSERTAAATPTSMAARPRRARRTVAWAIAACFVLTPLAVWAIDAAMTRDAGPPTRAVTAPSQPSAPVEPPAREAPGPSEEVVATDRAPHEQPAPTPTGARRRARDGARTGDDPMGRWGWE